MPCENSSVLTDLCDAAFADAPAADRDRHLYPVRAH